MEIPSTKKQFPNKYQCPKIKIPNQRTGYQTENKSPECLDHWTFEFGYYLKFDELVKSLKFDFYSL